MKRFVYNEKYAKLLVMMEGKKSQINDLAKYIDVNSGHLRNVLEQWHKEGILTKDRPGRDYVIKLTEKGSKLARKFAEIMQLVDKYVPDAPMQPDTFGERAVDSESDIPIPTISAANNRNKGGKNK